MDQYIGKFLDDRYELLERIGTGGMAMVYKAKCHWLNRFVAVKILKEDLAQDEEFCRRFHEESQAIAMLSHPNIVSVYDVSHTPDLDYIVMELIEGITLKQYMQKRGGKLNWKEALHFITQIMKGLSHAHSRGIIHRDIKPHNIMVLRDGSVKVTDFGIARLMSNNQSTMTQEALGSVHYISPEQARGSRIDERSDIYSAGVVLYEMLTGRLPYEGENPVAVAIQHINSIPLSPREIDPSIPEAIEEITMKAMASDADKRYASADAMLADLEEFRKNPNISFDYTRDDLLIGEGEEPTQNVVTTPPPVVPAHDRRKEDKRRSGADRQEGRKRPRRAAEPEEDDEDDYEESGGRGIWIAAVAVLLIAGMIAVGMFLWNTVFRDMLEAGKTYVVPDLYNYTLEEAKELPEVVENGFTVVEGKYIPSDTVEAGHIISQSPAADDVVKAGGQEITVTISVGDSTLSMPDVYNKDRRVAESTLRNMGLEVTIMEANSDEVTKGNVMSQTPAAEESVEKGAMVTLVVSLGRQLKEVQMIPLINLSLDEATRIITEELGLRVGTVVPETSDLAEGQVCYQSIAPYTLVKEETVVNLRVSTGTGIALPPNTTQTSRPSHSPELSPAPSSSAEPSASPEPTTPVIRRKDGTVRLPSDRETVTVRVTVDGVQQYNEPVNTQMRIAHFTIEGMGSQEVVVYIDDVETNRYTEDFSS